MRRLPRMAACILVLALFLGVVPASAGPRVPRWVARLGSEAPPEVAKAAASRFAIARLDGNDVRGPLDLRSMRIDRGAVADLVTFSAYQPVSNAAIDPDRGNFAVLFDNDNDRRFDFAHYVYFAGGRLRGVLVNLDTNQLVDRTAPVGRLNSRTFRILVQRNLIRSTGVYRFAVFGYYEASPCSRRRPCIDAIPNRFPLIMLDHKAPSVFRIHSEPYSGDVSDALVTPIGFRANDNLGGSGLGSWFVQRSEVGSGTWQAVTSGTSNDDVIVNVPGTEGATFDVRVVAIDRQKNAAIVLIGRTTFPWDDRAANAVYSGTTTQASTAGAFLGTTTSLDPSASVTFSFSGGSEVCFMGGPTLSPFGATADMVVDGLAVGSISEFPSTPPRQRSLCATLTTSGAHSVVVTSDSNPGDQLVVDGFYVVP